MLSEDGIESNIADLDDGWELKDGKIVKKIGKGKYLLAESLNNPY